MRIELNINLAGDTRNARATLERLLEDVLAYMRDQSRQDAQSPIPIDDLGMSVRTTNALLAEGIKTVGQLTTFSYHNIWRRPGIGRRAMWEIRDALKERGLFLLHDPSK
jgi:DNA-directed RNA polymerase alpha subunit